MENLLQEIECKICENHRKTHLGCDGMCKYDEKLMDRIKELFRLASYQIPMKIKAQQYIYTGCPRCNYDLSEHVNDGYYRVNKVKFCPNCGQALEWE